MRRIILALAGTIVAVGLLFGYRTSTSGPMTASGSAAATGANAVTGPVVQTRWGPVQVAISVDNGRITAVTVPRYPDGNQKDKQINARALPILVEETLRAQSAEVDSVSGATVTSEGYVSSLQGALDAAGISG